MTRPGRVSVDRLRQLSPEKRALLEQMREEKRAQTGTERAGAIQPRPAGSGLPPLSFAQQRLWFLDRLEPGLAAYNIPAALRIAGPAGACSAALLAVCLNEVARRHEPLRTTFAVSQEGEAGEPVQVIAPEPRLTLPTVDLAGLPEAVRSAETRDLAGREALAPFDLAAGPLLRATLLRFGEDAGEEVHLLLLTLHHIVADGWSAGVLIREVAALYEAFAAGRPSPLEPLAIQYADFAVWQRETLAGEALEALLGHWRGQLAGAPPEVTLTPDRPRPAVQRFRGASRSWSLEPEAVAALEALGRAEVATLFMVLLATFEAVLHRQTGEDDLVVGTPIANRNRRETEGLIGFFVNSLALRTRLDGGAGFRDLLARVRRTTLDAYAHQDLPFEKLVEALQPERVRNRALVFQLFFELDNVTDGLAVRLPSLKVELLELPGRTAKFDLALYFRPAGGGLSCEAKFDADLYDAPTVARLGEHFRALALAAAESPDRPLWDLPLLGEGERHQVTREWSGTAAEREPAGIHTLVEAQAARTPDAVAVVCGGESWTYAELERRSSELAARLRAALTPEGEPLVALCAGRTPSLVAGLLAAWKTGAAYVPLDPTHPAERLAGLLEETCPGLLLTTSDLLPALTDSLGSSLPPIFLLDGDLDEAPASALPSASPPSTRLAYVTFTSGSTGRPKGVMSTHGGAVNFLRYVAETWDLGPEDTVLQVAAPTFDASVRDTIGPLTAGARVVLVPGARDPEALLEAIDSQGVTAILSLVPTMLGELVRTAARLGWSTRRVRLLLLSGEPLRPSDVAAARRVFGDGVRLINQYGPTETTMIASYWEIPGPDMAADRPLPVGRTIPNLVFRLLDGAFGPVPAGAPGEVCLGGAGVTRGYFRRPDLTAERFVPDPLAAEPGARLYRTGDRGRWLADGTVELLGRLDRQVKVRGVRVEPGEVEAALAAHPDLGEVAVVAWEPRPGDVRLSAYFTANGTAPDASTLRDFLRPRLPEALWPSTFQALPALPRTATGKLDRRALPRPEGAEAVGPATAYEAPRTPTEETLCALWAELFGRVRVGIHDDFFALGGHSLLATQVVARVRRSLGVEVPLRALFDAPTVAGLAAAVGRLAGSAPAGAPETVAPLVPDLAGRDLPFPLTDIQQAYWVGRTGFFELGNVATHSYLELEMAELDPARLEVAVRRLIERHGMLRAVLRQDGTQQILPSVPLFELQVADLADRDAPGVEAGLSEIRQRLGHQVLQLDRWPLFEISASRLPSSWRLHISTDSLICDAWSRRVLARELFAFYEHPEREAAALTLSFRDCVLAEVEARQGVAYAAARDYWLGRLDSLPPAPELPLLAAPGSIAEPRFVRRGGRLEPAAWSRLKARAARAGLTPSGLIAAVYAETLGAWSKARRFTLNLTLFNRPQVHPEVNLLVGDFTSVILLAVDGAGTTFEERARRLQGQLWQDLDHRAFTGIQVLRELNRRAGGGARAVMPVVLTSTLIADPREERDFERPWQDVYGISQTSQVYLDHGVSEQAGTLVFRWDAVEDLFPAGLLDDLFVAYRGLLERLSAGDETAEAAWTAADLGLVPAAQLAERAAANATGGPLAETAGKLLHAPFLERARSQPDAVALISGSVRMTYGELLDRSGRLALRLRELGVRPGRLVAVVAEKGWEQAVAALAVVRSGGAYLPIDPALPAERRAYLLENGEVEVALTQGKHDKALEWPLQVRRLRVEAEEFAGPGTPAFEEAASPGDLAYVIFTSGSTGQPKGVMIDHRAALNTVLDINRRFGVGEGDRVLALSSLSFDLSVWDLFGIWAAGGAVVLPDPDRARDPAHWAGLLEREKVTVWNTVPVLLELLAEHLERQSAPLPESLRLAMMSGDWIPLSLPGRLQALAPAPESLALISLGGATEAAIWSNFHPIRALAPEWKSVPYGRPLSGQTFHVLDTDARPRPIWVPGMLHIGGAGLARGYWRDGARTAASFVPHPDPATPGERLYRTGDLGRYWPGGDLEFLGREDSQVKIQGHRVELGEIEAALARAPRVRAAAVAAVPVNRDPRGPRRLVAYVVPAEPDLDPRTLRDELRGFLGERLPAYMVPAVFVWLERLPLSSNGKVDRKALPLPSQGEEPEAAEGREAAGHARSPLEEVAASVWAEVLGREPAHPGEDFYAAGGDSVLAIRLVSRLREAAGAEVPLGRFFDEPTVAGLAARAEEALRPGRARRLPPLAPERGGPPALSFAQQRLWFLCQLDPGSSFYNIPTGVAVNGPLDAAALVWSLAEIVRRHEVLRTAYPEVKGRPAPEVREAGLAVPVIDLSGLPAARREATALDLARRHAREPFDLARPPLLRARLLRLNQEEGGERHLLTLVAHHIAFDAGSADVLLRELAALYRAAVSGGDRPLTALALQYSDFAAWQQRALDEEARGEQLAWWRERLAGPPPEIELPTDRPRPGAGARRASPGERLALRLGPELSRGLLDLTRREGSTLFMTLLAGFLALLHDATRQTDLTVATSVSERGLPGTEGMIGLFLNTLLIRVDAGGDPPFRELLRRVREAALGAFAHGDAPFDQVVKAALPPRQQGAGAPLSRVVFGLRGAPPTGIELGGLRLSPLDVYRGMAKFDLEVEMVRGEDGLGGFLEIDTGLFDATTAAALAEDYSELLAAAVARPDLPVSALLASLDRAARQRERQEQRRGMLRQGLLAARPTAVKVPVALPERE